MVVVALCGAMLLAYGTAKQFGDGYGLMVFGALLLAFAMLAARGSQ